MSSADAKTRTGASISLPPGWHPTRVVVAHDGIQGRVTLVREWLPDGRSVDDLARDYGDRLAKRVPGYSEEALERYPSSQGDVMMRRYISRAEGSEDRRGQLQAYAAAPGIAWVATAGEAAALSEEGLKQIVALLRHLVHPGTPFPGRVLSVEELTALAELAGSPSFPGTGEYRLADEAARSAARRALVASGALRSADPGQSPEVEETTARMITTALHATAAITVERRDGHGHQQLNVYVGPELSVTHRASRDGLHRLEPVPTGMVGAAVGRFAQLEERDPGKARTFRVSGKTFSRLKDLAAQAEVRPEDEQDDARTLAELLTQTRRSCQLRVAPRTGSGDRVVELAWIDCAQAGLWLLSARGDEVEVEPMDLKALSERFQALWSTGDSAGEDVGAHGQG